jgi:hypothetical protein
MARLLACLALVCLAGPAVACINDAELPTHEREFRSQYRGSVAPTPPPPPESTQPSGQPLLLGGGAALFLGAATLAWNGGRRRK